MSILFDLLSAKIRANGYLLGLSDSRVLPAKNEEPHQSLDAVLFIYRGVVVPQIQNFARFCRSLFGPTNSNVSIVRHEPPIWA